MIYATCHPDRRHRAHGLCQQCYNKEYYATHREWYLVYHKERRETRRDALAAYQRRWREANPDYMSIYMREWNENNPDYKAEWYAKHPDYHKEYMRRRRTEDINYRLADNMRSRISSLLVGKQRGGSAVRDLGCSISTFRLYIENQFEDGMTWDNYGDWHLDHVIPLGSFDLADRQRFLEAANWLNYQPLWAGDNIRKRDKVVGTRYLA